MSGVACAIALLSGLVVGSDDPTEWMIPLGGIVVGLIALVFVALANVTSTAVSMFASGLALRHIPWLRKSTWRSIVIVTAIPLVFFVIWPRELYDLGDAFLAYNGTMHAPIAGILLVDYFFLRNQRLNLGAIYDAAPDGDYYYWKGFNMLALSGIVIGQICYFALYNPFSGATHWLFGIVPASIAAFLVPAALYWIGMRFWLTQYLPRPGTTGGEGSAGLKIPNI